MKQQPRQEIAPMLLPTFLEISAEWRHCFPQQRTYLRALRQGLGGLVCLGRRTLARIIWTNGGEQRSWSGEYFLHSRCRWRPQQLFEPIWRKALPFCRGRLVGVAIDETRLRKTGRSIQQAFHQRDPLSPPFHVNLMLGLRFVQASLLVPLHRKAPTSARALPVRFECAPVPKRPGRRAGDEQREQYKQLQAQCRVSRRMAEMIEPLRAALDDAGGRSKTLVLALDGGFCNRTVFLAPRERVELLARARKDAVLCFGASGESRRFYAREKFRPQQVRRDETIEWRTAKLFYGGKRRKIRYKQVNEVYWQGGARRTPLRVVGRGADALSQEPFAEEVLSPTGLSVDDGPDEQAECAGADLFGSLANRGESSRGEGHVGSGTGTVVERAGGSQAAGVGGGGV